MKNKPTISDYLNLATMEALEQGGVDNWEWYGESLTNYGYKPLSDKYEDACDLLNALEQGGVDNWEWYDESLTGISEYEDYLREIGEGNLDGAMSFDAFLYELKEKNEKERSAARAQREEAEPQESLSTPKYPSGHKLYQYIVDSFGEDNAPGIYDTVINSGVWKFNTFPQEFSQAVKKVSTMGDLETARCEVLEKTINSGKMLTFIMNVRGNG